MKPGGTHRRRSDNRAALTGRKNRMKTREEIDVRMLSQHTAIAGRDSFLTNQQNAVMLVEENRNINSVFIYYVLISAFYVCDSSYR